MRLVVLARLFNGILQTAHIALVAIVGNFVVIITPTIIIHIIGISRTTAEKLAVTSRRRPIVAGAIVIIVIGCRLQRVTPINHIEVVSRTLHVEVTNGIAVDGVVPRRTVERFTRIVFQQRHIGRAVGLAKVAGRRVVGTHVDHRAGFRQQGFVCAEIGDAAEVAVVFCRDVGRHVGGCSGRFVYDVVGNHYGTRKRPEFGISAEISIETERRAHGVGRIGEIGRIHSQLHGISGRVAGSKRGRAHIGRSCACVVDNRRVLHRQAVGRTIHDLPVGSGSRVVVHHAVDERQRSRVARVDGRARGSRIVFEYAIAERCVGVVQHQGSCPVLHGSFAGRIAAHHVESVNDNMRPAFHHDAMVKPIRQCNAVGIAVDERTISRRIAHNLAAGEVFAITADDVERRAACRCRDAQRCRLRVFIDEDIFRRIFSFKRTHFQMPSAHRRRIQSGKIVDGFGNGAIGFLPRAAVVRRFGACGIHVDYQRVGRRFVPDDGLFDSVCADCRLLRV